MSDWKLLEEIVSAWQEAIPYPSALKKALDDLNKVGIHMLVNELCEDEFAEHDKHVLLFGKLLTMVRRAVEIDLRHPAIGRLANYCKKLTQAGRFYPDALNFFNELLKRYATTPDESKQAAIAFDGLLAGINKDNYDLTQASVLILSVLIPILSGDERNRLIEKIDALPEDFRKNPLVPVLKAFIETITRAEQAIKKHEQALDVYPPTVISVHSHKGGVGKTTIATAIAVELTLKEKKVCLVDCDDEGPSLFNMLPFQHEPQKDVMFFVDWFDSDMKELPLEKIPKIPVEEKELYCIPGSFLSPDITRLDGMQRGERAKSANYLFCQDRITLLIKILGELGFQCVILDTGPGLAHLSMDVLMATLETGGSQVFVMRPRAVDISQFCIEWDWLYYLSKRKGKACIVINFTNPKPSEESIDLKNGEELSEQIIKSPQYKIYTERLIDYSGTESKLNDIIKDILRNLAPIRIWPENEFLRYAEDISISPQNRTVEIICKEDGLKKTINSIIETVNNQQEGKERKE